MQPKPVVCQPPINLKKEQDTRRTTNKNSQHDDLIEQNGEKFSTAETASCSLRTETADQSCELNIPYCRTYLEKVFLSPIKRINSSLKKEKRRVIIDE